MGTAEARQVKTFCPLCVSRCGAVATLDGGTFTLAPDPSHPTGQALCIKGKSAPAITHHVDRLVHPLRRTTPRGSPDPGWEQVSWDEALDVMADRLMRIAAEHGPESVVFSAVSPSTSAIGDSLDWIQRLRRAFGSPNLCVSMELCGWGRYLAPLYTFGAPVPGEYLPDLERAECILFWGYNPSVSRLVHATATTAALRRGAKLIVVDPRRAGLASKADHWLRVRPGTDAALALAMTHAMIDNGWFDRDFVRQWTNAVMLVRQDTGRLLRADEIALGGSSDQFVAWNETDGHPFPLGPRPQDTDGAALFGTFEVPTTSGLVSCRPAFEVVAQACRAMAPTVAEEITGVPAESIIAAARMLWESRPVAHYTWSGLEMHSGSTQSARAINQLYALTGCLDAPGGNVLFSSVQTNDVDGRTLLSQEQRAKAIGLDARPLGPARFEFITGEDFYNAALGEDSDRPRALVGFGSNLLMAHGDSSRGRAALAALDFQVHVDLFMSPTAEQADIVLPAAGAFEVEGLRVGFEVSQEAQALVQLRRPLVAPRGEARSDLQIVFDLADRLGLGEHFFDGDIDAAYRHLLEPSGITLEQLREQPGGVRLPLETRHRKFADLDADGVPIGFATPTGRIELYSETLLEHGQPAVAHHEEPATSPRSRPDLATRFPLVLTCAKSLHFCETQHRGVAELRSRAPDPEVELHPEAATQRGITAGDWVVISTPLGDVRARAALNRNLSPDVVVGQHGWFEPCEELDLPGHPPFGPDSANLNLVLSQTPSDPVSGSSPLRAQLCEVALL